jgi:uncharacterized protein YjiS (DUF1127 family)
MSDLVIALSRHAGCSNWGISARFSRALKDFRKRQRARDTIAQLRSLDDRTLKDIGIHRSEILAIGAGIGADRVRRQ